MSELRICCLGAAALIAASLVACDNGKSTKETASAEATTSAKSGATSAAAPKTVASAVSSASASASASAGVGAVSASAKAAQEALPPHAPEALLEAIKAHPNEPTPQQWAAVDEVTVTGSSRAGCTTKVLPGWFYMHCVSKPKGLGYLDSLKFMRGLYRGQSQLTENVAGISEDGKPLLALTAITPYVKGTSLLINLRWIEGGNLDVEIEWPVDKEIAPERVGIVKQAPIRGDEGK